MSNTCPNCGSIDIEREELGKTTNTLPELLFCTECFTTIIDDDLAAKINN